MRCYIAGVVALVCAAGASQGAVVLAGSGAGIQDPRAASASFSVVGGNLQVVLTNTSAGDVRTTGDLLTAVFFEVSGGSLSLSPVSALLTSGSIVHNGSNGGGNVGGEWAYASGGSYPGGASYGIGSAGFDIFGGANFNGPNLDGPPAVNGANYGITSAGDNLATANGGLANDPIIKNSVTFTLSGLPANFDINRITAAYFQYGTSISEGGFRVPTPGALAALSVLGLGAARRRR